jgi:signal transduction histidine kinase
MDTLNAPMEFGEKTVDWSEQRRTSAMISSSDILRASILIVDDQEDNVSLLEDMLRGAGYVSIASTRDPHEVCELYRKNRYSLILLDLEMPGLDGFQVLEGVKAVETDGYLPVLVITAQPEHMLRALKAGARDFISRPFDLAEALVRVHNMLEVRLLHLEAKRRTEEAEARGEEAIRASHEQLRALAARIQAAREEERAHAAREIHDVLAQELTCLKMEVAWLSRRLAEPIGTWKQNVLQEKVGAIMDLTDKASQSVRRIAADLRPVVLDSLGLCAAIEWVAADFQKRTEICCEARVPGQGLAMDRDRSTALFRILQESLTNVARHAGATKVDIHLWREADEVILTVRDNGHGVQPSELKDPHSIGLLGMRERASMLEGRCAIRAQAGGGTTVEVRLPIASIVNPDNNL